jgi:hypothetical protein
MMVLDRDNAFYDYKAPTPTVDTSDATEKARTAAMSKANAASRPATFLEQVEAQIAKTTARLADVEAAQKVDIYGNPIIDPNSVEGRKAKVASDVAAVQAATPKPELTEQEIADGYIIKWIGTTNGKWQVIKPSAATIDATRKKLEAANWTGSGTAEDPKMYKGKPYTGGIGTADYVNGILKPAPLGGGNNSDGGGNNSDGGGLYTASDGKTFTDSDSFTIYQSGLDEKKANKVSAYNLLYDEFDKYGLGTLVSDIKNILVEGSLDPAEFSLKVRGTDAYKARFIANEARLSKGLRALSPAAYIALEDQYQEVMRQYGLPESYYAKTGTGVQEGFRKLIENDVSNIELEDRISTAQKRVINANPEVLASLKEFYPDISNADILAYTLDPKNAIENIKRKVTAAEIGGAATQAGLKTGMTRAEELAAAGITKDAAQQGFRTVAEVAPRGGQLAEIYKQSPYTQTTAEAEVFGLAGSTEAAKQRKKLTSLETAAFSGSAGAGAIARDRAGTL